MTIDSLLYRILKEELKARGNWKDAPRGDPRKGYKAQQNGKTQGKRGSSQAHYIVEPDYLD